MSAFVSPRVLVGDGCLYLRILCKQTTHTTALIAGDNHHGSVATANLLVTSHFGCRQSGHLILRLARSKQDAESPSHSRVRKGRPMNIEILMRRIIVAKSAVLSDNSFMCRICNTLQKGIST